MSAKKNFQKITSYIYNGMWIVAFLLCFNQGLKRILNNIFNLNNFEYGIVQKNQYLEHTSSLGITTFTNKSNIKLFKGKETLTSTNIYELKKGDTVRVRDVGDGINNIVFEVNGKTVESPYDWLDYFSPPLVILSIIGIYFYFIRPYLNRFKNEKI